MGMKVPFSISPHTDVTMGEEAGGGYRFCDRCRLSVLVFHQHHIHGIGIFGGTDDAQAIAAESTGIIMDHHIKILSCRRADMVVV